MTEVGRLSVCLGRGRGDSLGCYAAGERLLKIFWAKLVTLMRMRVQEERQGTLFGVTEPVRLATDAILRESQTVYDLCNLRF